MADSIRFKVRQVFITRLLGSAPASKDLLAEFIASKKREAEEKRIKFAERSGTDAQPAVGTVEEEVETISETAGITVFHSDLGQIREDGQPGEGLFLFDYQVCGFFKEAAEVLNDEFRIPMVRSKLDNFLMVSPRRVYLKNPDGLVIGNAHGRLERPLRAMTMQGPRIALACSEFIESGCFIEYTLDFLPYLKSGKGKEKSAVHLKEFVTALLTYGSRKGCGQWRNGGFGRFTATFEEC